MSVEVFFLTMIMEALKALIWACAFGFIYNRIR